MGRYATPQRVRVRAPVPGPGCADSAMIDVQLGNVVHVASARVPGPSTLLLPIVDARSTKVR